MYLGATILVIIAGIILVFTLAAIMIKVENLIFGKISTTQVENPNNEGANNNDENKEIAIYDENSK